MFQLSIREATENDLPALVDIYNYYIRTSTATFDTVEQTIAERRAWLAEHKKEGLPTLVAVREGLVIGWQSLSRYHSRCAYRQTVESSTYIAPGECGRGAGKKLLQAALVAAQQLKFHSVVGLIESQNKESLALVNKLGFDTVGTLKEVGRKFDRWLDVTIVQKILAEGN